jgi:hypothetical protein
MYVSMGEETVIFDPQELRHFYHGYAVTSPIAQCQWGPASVVS